MADTKFSSVVLVFQDAIIVGKAVVVTAAMGVKMGAGILGQIEPPFC